MGAVPGNNDGGVKNSGNHVDVINNFIVMEIGGLWVHY